MGILSVRSGLIWKVAGLVGMLAVSLGVGVACGSEERLEPSNGAGQFETVSAADFESKVQSLDTLGALQQSTGEYGIGE